MADPIVPFIGPSGLDTSAIIDALANARRSPILRLQQQVTKLQRQSTEFGTLRTRLEALRAKAAAIDTPQELRAFSAASSDTSVLSVSASSAATEGTYTITVNSLAQAESRISAGFAAKTGSPVGSGTIAISAGGKNYAITLAGHEDLEGLRDAINASAAPITATVIDDGSGTNQYKLVLSAESTGAGSTFSVDTSAFTPAGTPLGFTVLNPAQDAVFTLNGATIHRASNTVTDLVPGVNLTLLKGAGSTSTVTVSKDREAVKNRIKDFVNAYNDLNDLIRTNSNADNKATTAVLYGDSTLRSAQTQLRGVIDTRFTGTGSAYDSLASIGITTGSDGKLGVDDTKLTAALSADYDAVVSIFTTPATGIAVKARLTAQNLVDNSVRTRTDGIQTRIRGINTQVGQLQDRLETYIESLRKKFSALDSIAGRLQSQGGALASLGN